MDFKERKKRYMGGFVRIGRGNDVNNYYNFNNKRINKIVESGKCGFVFYDLQYLKISIGNILFERYYRIQVIKFLEIFNIIRKGKY